MAGSMNSMAGTLEVFLRVVGWGLAIVLGVLWAWVFFGSQRRAKASQNLQDWSSSSYTSDPSRPNDSSPPPEPDATADPDIINRITRPVLNRQGL